MTKHLVNDHHTSNSHDSTTSWVQRIYSLDIVRSNFFKKKMWFINDFVNQLYNFFKVLPLKKITRQQTKYFYKMRSYFVNPSYKKSNYLCAALFALKWLEPRWFKSVVILVQTNLNFLIFCVHKYSRFHIV